MSERRVGQAVLRNGDIELIDWRVKEEEPMAAKKQGKQDIAHDLEKQADAANRKNRIELGAKSKPAKKGKKK